MEVVIDGSKYLVGWRHDKNARITVCSITVVQPGHTSAACFAASSRVHPKDQYVKEIGRKHSLKAAIAKLWPEWGTPQDKAKAKAGRAAIWKAYWDRKKGGGANAGTDRGRSNGGADKG